MRASGLERLRRVVDLLAGTVRHALHDNVPTMAGALTYHALLSLFPGLIVVAGLLSSMGREATSAFLVDVTTRLLPAEAAQALREPVEQLVAGRAGTGALLSVSTVIALWSASAYVGAFVWAARHVYEVTSTGTMAHGLVRRVGFALAILVLLALLGVALVSSGPVVEALAGRSGLKDSPLDVYLLLRLPLMLAAVVVLLGVLYAAAPAARAGGVRGVVWGSLLAVVVWLAATAVFDFYVERSSRYGVVYGTLGGVVVFLLWLWIFNIAVLLGAELNAELARRRAAGDEAPLDVGAVPAAGRDGGGEGGEDEAG